jgi:hypothetical protein
MAHPPEVLHVRAVLVTPGASHPEFSALGTLVRIPVRIVWKERTDHVDSAANSVLPQR